MHRLYGVLLTAILLFTSACTVMKKPGEDLDPLADERRADDRIIRPAADTSEAVKTLLVDARGAARAGNITRAESLLERALRIEPNNAVLWHYTAKMHLHQGRLSKAKGLAAKSNSLAQGNKELMADNWRIIAHAENRLGNMDKAQKAQQQVDKLSN